MQNIKIDATDSEGIRAALASYIAGMDTLAAMRVITDALELVICNASDAYIWCIEAVNAADVRIPYGSPDGRNISTFDVLDHATACLRSNRDNAERGDTRADAAAEYRFELERQS